MNSGQFSTAIDENKLCAKVGKVLQEHYPGWSWYVDCTLSTGIISVRCLNLHGDYGFVLYVKDVEVSGGEHSAITAGGELLERCNFPRGKRPEQLIADRDSRGNITTMDTYSAGGA